MSDKKTIESLLWALDVVGIRYSKKYNGFEVAPGLVFTDPVEAAGARAEYIRSLEVKTQQTFPNLLSETITSVKDLGKGLLPSGIPTYQKDLKEVLDATLFDMHKIIS